MTLAACDRALLLGISMRTYAAIAARDRRIFDEPMLATAGSLVRMARWINADCPAPDLKQLEFIGDDSVREIVQDVISAAPWPVAWHACIYVTWIEVGRRAIGTQSVAPVMRAPDGDQPHMILLSGVVEDKPLRGVVAHELGHSWSRGIHSIATNAARMSDHEIAARSIAAAEFAGVTRDQLVREHVANEALADNLANLWLGPGTRTTDYAQLLRSFRKKHDDAADLAAQIEHGIDGNAHRVAATTTA